MPCTVFVPLRGIRRRRRQPLAHPTNSSAKTSLHRLSLASLLRVTSHKTGMLHAGKVPVVKSIALLLQLFERLRLQVRRVHRIKLRREDLYRYPRRDRVDVSLRQQRWMSDGETVQQRLRALDRIELFGSKIEASPAAVAIPYSSDLWIPSSQMASACQNFGRPSLAGVCGEILVEVELRPWRLPGGEDVCWQRIVVEAMESVGFLRENASCIGKLTSLAHKLWLLPPVTNGPRVAYCYETPSRRGRI